MRTRSSTPAAAWLRAQRQSRLVEGHRAYCLPCSRSLGPTDRGPAAAYVSQHDETQQPELHNLAARYPRLTSPNCGTCSEWQIDECHCIVILASNPMDASAGAGVTQALVHSVKLLVLDLRSIQVTIASRSSSRARQRCRFGMLFCSRAKNESIAAVSQAAPNGPSTGQAVVLELSGEPSRPELAAPA